MEQFEAMGEVLNLEHSVAASNSAVVRPNLRFRRRSPPICRRPAEQPNANADQRLHAELAGQCDDLAQFLELLDHHDHLLVQLGAEQRHADEAGVLVTIADNQAASWLLHRQAGEQLRLAADLQTEIERLAGIQDFLHHLAQLIHFDGEDAAILASVIELSDGVAEREVMDSTR